MIRVAASEAARHEAITAQVMVIMRRSSRYFAIVRIPPWAPQSGCPCMLACADLTAAPCCAPAAAQGLRLFFAFGPLVLYVLGEQRTGLP